MRTRGRPRGRHWRLAAPIAVTAALLSAGLAAGAESPPANPHCGDAGEIRNTWAPIPVSGFAPGALNRFDSDPCVLIAAGADGSVWTAEASGRSWHRVGHTSTTVSRLITSGLPAGEVFAVPAPSGGAASLTTAPGLLVSTDGGHQFRAASGLTGARVLDVATTPAQSGLVVAAVSGSTQLTNRLILAGQASVLESTDGGRSWAGLPGSAALAATSVAIDPIDPTMIWANDTTSVGGLWLSTDGGRTFVRKTGDQVSALSATALVGGGSELYAATAAGLYVTRDAAASGSTLEAGTAFTGVVTETGHPEALMLLTAAGVRRSVDGGASSRDVSAGMPAGCHPNRLDRDSETPSSFLARCGSGTPMFWRYRSDGVDLAATDTPGGASSGLANLPVTGQPMQELAHLPVTRTGNGYSGTIAFDGDYLYYSDANQAGRIHRTRVLSGRDGGELAVDWPLPFTQLAYDSLRHLLYVADQNALIQAVDLHTGRLSRLFTLTGFENDGGTFSFTYDSSTEQFLAVHDHGAAVSQFDRSGRLLGSCGVELAAVGFGGVGTGVNLAAVVATGDGEFYGEVEDDATVLRMDRSCHVLATYTHPVFSEAQAENDAMACDTVTFPQGAIWLRDATAGQLVAYAVPGGYCALATQARVTSAPRVTAGDTTGVCATLNRAGSGEPISGARIDLFVADHSIGSPTTGADGRACVGYRPSGSDVPPPVRQGQPPRLSNHPVVANFLGTTAFRPTSARTSVAVAGLLTVSAPPGLVVAAAAVVAPPPVPPPPAPPAPPPGQAQPQPLGQPHPGVQPGAVGAPGAAPDRQEQVEAEGAGAKAGVAEYTAVESTTVGWPLAVGCAAILGGAVMVRRRASRVRAQGG